MIYKAKSKNEKLANETNYYRLILGWIKKSLDYSNLTSNKCCE